MTIGTITARAGATLEGDAPERLRVVGAERLSRDDFAELVVRGRAAGVRTVTVVPSGAPLDPRALADGGADEIEIVAYTTVPGEHDAITRRRDSHAALLATMTRIAETPLGVRVVIPLLSRRVQDLAALVVDCLARCPRAVAVELTLPATFPRRTDILMPEPMEALRERIAASAQAAKERGVPLTTRGIAFCLLPASQRRSAESTARGPDDVMAEGCGRCPRQGECRGVPRYYADAYGLDALTPLEELEDGVGIDPAAHPEPTRGPIAPRDASRFRVVLVNLCEATWGYGPGAAEYLRAELLARLGERVDVEILFLVNQSADAAADAIWEMEPDVVGFSCYSWNLADSGAVSRRLKARGARFPIVWGGVSFAFLDRDASWFSWWDAVDAVARGSGESTLVQLVERLLAGPRRIDHVLPGLLLPRAGGVEVGPPAIPPSRLDDLASPYLSGTVYQVARPTIEMARGCQFQCAFCSDAKDSREGRMVAHSVERIAQEISAVTRWPGASWIDAGASTANVTDAVFEDVCAAIRQGDPEGRLRYGFQLYPALARPAQREALRGVNVGALHFGVQSLTPATFGAIRRGTRLSHVERALSVFEGVGPLELSLILGLPGETFDSFRQVFDELVRFSELRLVVNRLLVLPGTQLHLHRRALGLEIEEERYYRIRSTPSMSARDLRRAQDYVIDRACALPDLVKGGEARVRWVNFDAQRSFAAPAEYGASFLPA